MPSVYFRIDGRHRGSRPIRRDGRGTGRILLGRGHDGTRLGRINGIVRRGGNLPTCWGWLVFRKCGRPKSRHEDDLTYP